MERKPKKKRVKKVLIIIVIVFAVLCGVGAVCNAVDTAYEKKTYLPEGELVDVFDTQIHVFSRGERAENAPAIVLLSGHAAPSPTADYYPVWSRMAEKYQTVVLERPGYGWSDNTNRERTIENITEEDKRALEQAGIAPPYVLVAHSMGGIEANVFANLYPEETVGVLLIDATALELMLEFPASPSFGSRMITPLRYTGVLRLINAIAPDMIREQSQGMRNSFEFVDEHYKQIDIVFALQKYQDSMMIKEYELRQANAAKAQQMPFPEDIPVLLLMADYGEEIGAENQKYVDMQIAWVEQSQNGWLEMMSGGHYLHHENPAGVCAAIEQIISMI